jgi:hypothetical protein
MLHFLKEHFYEFVFLVAGFGIGVIATMLTQFIYGILSGTWGVVKTVTNATSSVFKGKSDKSDNVIKFGESYKPTRAVANGVRREPTF